MEQFIIDDNEDIKQELSTPLITNNIQTLPTSSLFAPRLRSWLANPRRVPPLKPLAKE